MPSTVAQSLNQQPREPTLRVVCLRMVEKTNNNTSCSVMRGKPVPLATAAASQSTIFRLCALIYMTFNLSSAVPAQFLTLFYKSKGFDGTVLGILSCLTPVTTFVMAPLWGLLLGRTDPGQSQFSILYLTIILSVMIRTSMAIFLPTPTNFLIISAWQGVFHAPIRPMMDAIVMDHLSDRTVFGKVRLFGILGTGIGTSLGGYLLTLKSDIIMGKVDIILRQTEGYLSVDSITRLSNIGHGLSGFDFLFIAHTILTIPLLYYVRELQLLNYNSRTTTPPPATPKDVTADHHHINSNSNGKSRGYRDGDDENSSNAANGGLSTRTTTTANGSRPRTTVRMQDVAGYVVQETAHVILFTIVYIMGISGGVGDAFAYLRFQEVGFTPSHMGTSRLLSSFAGAIMFWFSGAINEALGIDNVIVMGLFSVGCRFLLYTMMNHPYYAYLAEVIRGGIYGVFWSAAAVYASEKIGPPSLRATMLLILNGLYEGMGRSTGAILGGKIQAIVGTETLFLYVALTYFGLALLMIAYNKLLKSKSNTTASNSSNTRRHVTSDASVPIANESTTKSATLDGILNEAKKVQ